MREDSFVDWIWDPHHHDCVNDERTTCGSGEKETVLAGRWTSFGQEGMGEMLAVCWHDNDGEVRLF